MHRILVLAVLATVTGTLTACSGFDPDKLDVFGLNEKKKLPGERREVFPGGVPGVTQGIPPEYLKGNQPAAETAEAPAGEPGKEKTAAAAESEPAPKPKPKRTPKPRTASKPTQVTVQPQQQQPDPVWAQQNQQPTQQQSPAPWPAQGQATTAAPWPSSPSPGTFSR
jgi:hypothetical protein